MFDPIIVTISSLLSYILVDYVAKFIRKYILKRKNRTFSERLKFLTGNLVNASKEVDSVLFELNEVTKERENKISRLEIELSKMEQTEKELKEKIEKLQNVPLPVAEYFSDLLATKERRSAKRDYLLFAAGVIVTTLITILLQFLNK